MLTWFWTQGPAPKWKHGVSVEEKRSPYEGFNGTVEAPTRELAIHLAREECAKDQVYYIEHRTKRRPLSGADVRVSLPQYTSFGGQTMLYLDRENDCYCARCAAKSEVWEEHGPITWGVFDEGSPETCADCGREIESFYGDPDDEHEENDANTNPEQG
jgi:hypothetical protein